MSAHTLIPSAEFRDTLRRRGGHNTARCYQCATCSSVCELAPADAPFPRRQMLLAQWGLGEELAGDPAVWLCHRCNDCSTRCPRDAKPGEMMAAVRSLTVETLAAPGFMGKLVGNAARTWPLLVGLPILFWVVLLYLTTGFHVPEPTNTKIIKEHAIVWVAPAYADEGEAAHHGYKTVTGNETRLIYEEFVPHKLIYAVYFTTAALVLIAIIVSGARFWRLIGRRAPRSGSALAHLVPVFMDVAVHRRFGKCGTAGSLKWPHFGVLWGFVGAALTSGLLIVAMYVTKDPLPLEQMHPYKILGNVSALLLLFGGVLLVVNRLTKKDETGVSTAFDTFFLSVVALLIITGIVTEIGAFVMSPVLACTIYVIHLGMALCLFITFPYSKFAHMVYRTMAMVHERMAQTAVAGNRD